MRRKKIMLTVVAATLSLGVAATAVAATRDDDVLTEMVAQQEATAALLYDGRHHAAGVGDLSTREPADPRGHFRIGSVTKTFVATVILQLTDEDRLDLDDPVERHLPGLVPDGERITVRQILDHTSGLYDYMHEPGYSTNRWRGEERFDDYSPRQLLDVAFASEPYFPPGGGWHYSNTNYIVAGLLIERLTGNDYGSEIEQRILKPLRLRHTSVPGGDASIPEPYARGYTTVDGNLVDASEQNPSLDWAAGEMISTTKDLSRYFTALLGGDLISDDALDQMRETVATGSFFEYGLGLQRFELPCGETVFGHSGQLLGYTTYATVDEDGRTVTLSYNPGRKPVGQERLTRIFAETYCR